MGVDKGTTRDRKKRGLSKSLAVGNKNDFLSLQFEL